MKKGLDYFILEPAKPETYMLECAMEVVLTSPPPIHDFACEAEEDMGALFKTGDIIFIKKVEKVFNGELLALVVNKKPCIKKLYFNDEVVRLVSLNTEYDDKIFKCFSDIQLIGKVVL